MSKIVIKSDDLYRFSKLVDDGEYIRIEIKDHKAFMIASNEIIACVKYFGDSFGTNEIVYIKVDATFKERMEFESKLLTPVTLETVPEFGLATLKTDKDISESLVYLDETFMTTGALGLSNRQKIKDSCFGTLIRCLNYLKAVRQDR